MWVGVCVCRWCVYVFILNKPIRLADLLASSFFVRFGCLCTWSTSKTQFSSSDWSIQWLTPSQTSRVGMHKCVESLHSYSLDWHPVHDNDYIRNSIFRPPFPTFFSLFCLFGFVLSSLVLCVCDVVCNKWECDVEREIERESETDWLICFQMVRVRRFNIDIPFSFFVFRKTKNWFIKMIESILWPNRRNTRRKWKEKINIK